jgi:hypothetical protein
MADMQEVEALLVEQEVVANLVDLGEVEEMEMGRMVVEVVMVMVVAAVVVVVVVVLVKVAEGGVQQISKKIINILNINNAITERLTGCTTKAGGKFQAAGAGAGAGAGSGAGAGAGRGMRAAS